MRARGACSGGGIVRAAGIAEVAAMFVRVLRVVSGGESWTDTNRKGFPMTSSEKNTDQYARGKVPFKNYVIAVLDTSEKAQEAAKALEEQGFAAADIVLSAPLHPGAPDSEREQGTLADPPSISQRLFTEEGLDQAEYAEERRRGHVVIQVRTDDSADVERAHETLMAHGAHTIKRVGTWTRENLPEE